MWRMSDIHAVALQGPFAGKRIARPNGSGVENHNSDVTALSDFGIDFGRPYSNRRWDLWILSSLDAIDDKGQLFFLHACMVRVLSFATNTLQKIWYLVQHSSRHSYSAKILQRHACVFARVLWSECPGSKVVSNFQFFTIASLAWQLKCCLPSDYSCKYPGFCGGQEHLTNLPIKP